MCDDGKGIDDVTCGDRNVIKRGAEKILKYKDCTMETECMWTVSTKVLPVIIGAIGTVSISLRQYLSNIPGKREIKGLKKTAILGTAHQWRTEGGFGVFKPPPAEIPKALQNRAKFNPIVKTVKNC